MPYFFLILNRFSMCSLNDSFAAGDECFPHFSQKFVCSTSCKGNGGILSMFDVEKRNDDFLIKSYVYHLTILFFTLKQNSFALTNVIFIHCFAALRLSFMDIAQFLALNTLAI